jgi:hypothetical protein
MRPGAGDEALDGKRGHALSAPGLAHHPQCLSAAHGIGDTIDRPHGTAGGEEMRPQIFDFQDRFARRRACFNARSGDPCRLIQQVTPMFSAC